MASLAAPLTRPSSATLCERTVNAKQRTKLTEFRFTEALPKADARPSFALILCGVLTYR